MNCLELEEPLDIIECSEGGTQTRGAGGPARPALRVSRGARAKPRLCHTWSRMLPATRTALYSLVEKTVAEGPSSLDSG